MSGRVLVDLFLRSISLLLQYETGDIYSIVQKQTIWEQNKVNGDYSTTALHLIFLDHLTAVAETLWTRGPSLRALSQIFCFQSPETEIELRTECLTGYADASLPVWRHAATWTHGTWSELSGNISQPPEPDTGTGMRTEYFVQPSTWQEAMALVRFRWAASGQISS